MTKLIGELEILQSEIINIAGSLSDDEFRNQYHPDLSPIGWHLGHSTYIESYWVREQLLDLKPQDETLCLLYVPEMSIKKQRGEALPDQQTLINWAKTQQNENRLLLEKCLNDATQHHLLKDNFLLHFLIQHYSQHLETIKMIQTEIQFKNEFKPASSISFLTSEKINPEIKSIPAGNYQIGSNNNHRPYDNEHPAQNIKLESFEIAIKPVSNTEYLNFINDGGYSKKEYWSREGWDWKLNNDIKHPHHWRHEEGWFGINHESSYSLKPEQAVYGISYYEASAYAKWAGARLPHEYEWETASNANVLEQTYLVWEWCNNTFHPYPGFMAYPYEGYSSPYFDEKHYVIKGGSCYTKPAIKRSSFRNYYTADKRHIFAGLRLVFD